MLKKKKRDTRRVSVAIRALSKRKENKGGRWIPRLQEAKKDVASCEKRRGGASSL